MEGYINIPLSFRSNKNVASVIHDWGMESYGIMIALIELIENDIYCECDLDVIADSLDVSCFKLNQIIVFYNVFDYTGKEKRIVCKVLNNMKKENILFKTSDN